jgi:hypothetical protein
MQKKLTITIHESVYDALHAKIGRGNISRFLENLVRPYVDDAAIAEGYAAMAADGVREADALAWCEEVLEDGQDEAG